MIKPTVVFVRVCGKEEYEPGAKKWLSSYLNHRPDIEHDVVVINRYCEPRDDSFSKIAKEVRYDGTGWDVGSWKWAARNIQSELLCCFNSSTYITGDGWLERFVEAAEANGKGLYGPLASYEIIPHIRTPCFIFHPDVMNQYPGECEDRESTYRFEVFGYPDGTPNFTQWARGHGYQTMLITWSGVYDLPQWRTPKNVFRNGDQSDLIIRDRHCEAYEISTPEGKAILERLADGR